MAKKQQFIETFEIILCGSLHGSSYGGRGTQQNLAQQMLNLFYVNDQHINYIDKKTKTIMSKYDNHPNIKKLQEAHENLARANVKVRAKVGLDKKGRIHFIEIVK